MKQNRTVFLFSYRWKAVGIIILAFAVLLTVVISIAQKTLYVNSLALAPAISVGLVFIFFSRDKIDDERIHYLKFNSLAAGFLATYLLSFMLQYFKYTASMYEFVAFSLALSTAAFYFLRAKSAS